MAWIKMLFSSCALKCAYLCGHFHLCLHVNVCVYINLCLFWAAYSDGWQTKKSEKLTKRDKKEYKPNKQRSFAFFYFSRLGIRHKAKHQKRISINKAQSLPRMKQYKTRASKIWMNEWMSERFEMVRVYGLKCSFARMHCAYHAVRMLGQNRF